MTRKSFQVIRGVRPKKLYIAADGPRTDVAGEDRIVEEVRSIISEVDWDCELKTLFRNENLGCRDAVSSAINWFFENEEKGIIIEDDILPSNSFFRFCDELLLRYENDSSIGMISGCNLVANIYSVNESYLFTKYGHIWGWATWRRAWNLYDIDMRTFDKKTIKGGGLFDFHKEGLFFRSYWSRVFKLVKLGKINTWDYQWTYALWSNNLMSISPSVNLIENIGFNTLNATHVTSAVPDYIVLNPKAEIKFPLKHPSKLKRNILFDELEKNIVFDISLKSFIKNAIRSTPVYFLVKVYKKFKNKL